jgi:hypothetical protein
VRGKKKDPTTEARFYLSRRVFLSFRHLYIELGCSTSISTQVINGELVPRAGAVRPHGHLKMAKFTQHFEDLLDYTKTPLEW